MKPTAEVELVQTEIGPIPKDWGLSKLESISLDVTDGSHFSPKISSEGRRIIATVKDMTYNRFTFENCKRISEKDFQKLVRDGCSPNRGDILISKDGANCLDLIFVYDQDEKVVVLSSIAMVKLSPGYDPQFYRYYLLSPSAQHLMRAGYVSGSAIPRVVLKDLKLVPVPVPTHEEQVQIGTILASLDRKIELNRQVNKTLEAIAKSIFRYWFVDFEFPNEKGRPYRTSGGEMVYNEELGKEIPKGWSLVDLPDIASVIDCLHSKKPEKTEDGPILLQFYNLSPEHSIDLTDVYHVSEVDYKNWTRNVLVREGDLLFTNAGRQAIARVPYWFEGGIGRNITAVRPEGIDSVYLLHYFLSAYGTKQIGSNVDEGTILSSLNVKGIRKLKVLVPPSQLQNGFSSVAAKMLAMVETNIITSKNLSQIRDYLLPKLMSGKIRVPVEVR